MFGFWGCLEELVPLGIPGFPSPSQVKAVAFPSGLIFLGGLCIVLKLGQGETQGCDS